MKPRKNVTHWKHFMAHICLLMFIVGYHNVDAQDQLPFGAKARPGMDKGAISDTAFTPDGTRLAIASNVGVWLYEAVSYTHLTLPTNREV